MSERIKYLCRIYFQQNSSTWLSVEDGILPSGCWTSYIGTAILCLVSSYALVLGKFL